MLTCRVRKIENFSRLPRNFSDFSSLLVRPLLTFSLVCMAQSANSDLLDLFSFWLSSSSLDSWSSCSTNFSKKAMVLVQVSHSSLPQTSARPSSGNASPQSRLELIKEPNSREPSLPLSTSCLLSQTNFMVCSKHFTDRMHQISAT